MSERPRARVLGRVGRLILGILVLVSVIPSLTEGGAFAGTALAVAVGCVIVYSILHIAIVRYLPGLNPWAGAALAVAPAVFAALLGGPAWLTGIALFIGISLLVDAARADAGCEVMALPGLVFGKRTHLACFVLSPIDQLEHRWAERGAGGGGGTP